DARGLITGLTRGSTRAHLARAALEAIAYQVRDVVEAIPGGVIALRADGGAAANGWLMQFQADLLGMAVEVAVEREMTALGAAALAAGGAPAATAGRIYEPRMSRDQADALHHDWLVAVQRARSAAPNPISASPAPTRKATWKPSTSALGINARLFPWSPRYESYRVNVIVDSTATPSAPPTCCEVLIRPEAMPASSWVTPINEAIWTGTNEKPSPIPARMKPGARSVA